MYCILLQLAGATYMEVHQAGGGINFTVKRTRSASEDTLLDLLKERLARMLKSGTTSFGLKSQEVPWDVPVKLESTCIAS